MKKILITLLLLLFICPTVELNAEAGGFGAKKELRKRNKRTKKINRKNGVGYLGQPDQWDWMLPKVFARKEVNHG